MFEGALPVDTAVERDAFMERFLKSVGGMFDILAIYRGDRLNFYRAMAGGETINSRELAARTGTQERYVREWLEQQTVTGILTVINPEAGPMERRFRLPAAMGEVLTDEHSLNYLAPLAQMMLAISRPMETLISAFRNGGGVPYTQYGAEFREGQAAINRTMFLEELGQVWIPAMPDVHARLRQRDIPARVADIGCGGGWSSIGLAKMFPHIRVDGYDPDAPSMELARANAAENGVSDRVRFYTEDAAEVASGNRAGTYDLVMAFECIHDLSDPVGVLKSMRLLAGEKGTVLIADERVGDRFTPEGNDVEWMMYGWSIFHCLPVGMADNPSVGTGTVMRTDTLRQYASAAGFRDVEILPVENYFFRFYRLR